jgi:hypothetical protein
MHDSGAVTRRPGHDSGQRAGFDWADYVDWLIASAGSLAAVADRLCAQRGHKDDVASVERALRRLRRRGTADGGTWGLRAVTTFGLPGAIDRRVRALAQYHGRLADLPVSTCEDLLRAWDKPPITEARAGRAWIALGRAAIALREARLDAAVALLDRARADLGAAPVAARLEALLMRAYVQSRADRAAVAAILDDAAPLIDAVDDDDDRACLRARLVDHRAYELNQAGQHAAAEALYRALPEDAPPFARARRASGLAYARWKRGEPDAVDLAKAAIEHAGDGGHLRARAMALRLHARITGDDDAGRRALAIARALEDETLLGRFRR